MIEKGGIQEQSPMEHRLKELFSENHDANHSFEIPEVVC